jgi:hypothetical protein
MHKKPLSMCASYAPVRKTRKRKWGLPNMPNIRRSLTITETNDRMIQHLRSSFLRMNPPCDIDYTTMTNLVLEVGSLLLDGSNWDGQKNVIDSQKLVNIIQKYSFNTGLESDVIGDQIQDWLMRQPFKEKLKGRASEKG